MQDIIYLEDTHMHVQVINDDYTIKKLALCLFGISFIYICHALYC
jgi:hypothetical protein